MPVRRALLVAFPLALAACATPREAVREVVREEYIVQTTPPAAIDTAAVTQAVTAALRAQQDEWNAGDLRGFMDVYLRNQQTTFLSGGSVREGWRAAFSAYQRAYPDRASMGTLAFTDLHVRPLSNETALVWGRWRLTREADAPGGLFTLLMERRMAGDWRIVHDHTSSE